jgi:TonB family protein
MNRLNLNWFAIAALGSMLVHVLAIGWWLANSSDSQGGARGVSVSIVARGISSNTADPTAANPQITVPRVDTIAPLHSDVEPSEPEQFLTASKPVSNMLPLSSAKVSVNAPDLSDVKVVTTIAPSGISVLGPQAVVKNAANEKITGLAENTAEVDPITRTTHELADLTERADGSPATAEPSLSLATLPVAVNEVSATEDTQIKDAVSSLANQGDDSDRPPSYDLGSDRNPKPNYPYIAKKRGWQGDVLIGVDVKQDGWPERVRVIESSGFGLLDNAAVATIRDTWQFQPAQRLRRAVVGYTEVPISFRLN